MFVHSYTRVNYLILGLFLVFLSVCLLLMRGLSNLFLACQHKNNCKRENIMPNFLNSVRLEVNNLQVKTHKRLNIDNKDQDMASKVQLFLYRHSPHLQPLSSHYLYLHLCLKLLTEIYFLFLLTFFLIFPLSYLFSIYLGYNFKQLWYYFI